MYYIIILIFFAYGDHHYIANSSFTSQVSINKASYFISVWANYLLLSPLKCYADYPLTPMLSFITGHLGPSM